MKIITDSGCDLPKEIAEKYGIQVTPLWINFEDEHYKDGVDLNHTEFYQKLQSCQNLPKTASPSPQDFLEQFDGEEEAIVLTLSSSLSGTWKVVEMAKSMIQQINPLKKIHVIDTLNASISQGLIAIKAGLMAREGYNAEDIIEQLKNYINNFNTIFVLDTLDNLVKGGRLDKVRASLSSILSIKLIMGNKNGEIEVREKVRGMGKALRRIADMIGERAEDIQSKVLGIAHCNCIERALEFKAMVEQRYNFKEIIITTMGPTIATYAGQGGILIGF